MPFFKERSYVAPPLISSLVLAIVPFGFVHADNAKHKSDHDTKSIHATITKLDSQNHKLSVKTMGSDGKEQEKTLQLSKDVRYLNAAGKEAKPDSFKVGDFVCVMQRPYQVTELREEAVATITKVDRNAGTITLKVTGDSGKTVEKTFRLVEDSEYIDSTGRLAVLDVFQSGDDILFIEADGRIKSMRQAADTRQRPVPKRTTTRKRATNRIGPPWRDTH